LRRPATWCFEFQSDRFALVAVDTGIVKRIDPAQWEWLVSALDRARGKLTMAVLGHPLYAKAFDMTSDNPEFARLKRLLVDHGVTIVMAGDTHDFEYYREPPTGGGPGVHYFVNGGGGACLSIGTALDWPANPPTADWAFYPDRDALVRKIDGNTPWWKSPAWWWTKRYHAWPFASEYVSALFDYNSAPFFQSFVEVRVERSANRLRLIPYGVHGRRNGATTLPVHSCRARPRRLDWSNGPCPCVERQRGQASWPVPVACPRWVRGGG
jgi:hypothetical protein